MDPDEELTVWCGNLPQELSEETLYELFLQVAPLKKVRIPTDGKTGRRSNFGFVTFKHAVSVPYAISMFNGTKLYERSIIVRTRNQNLQPAVPSPPQNHHNQNDKVNMSGDQSRDAWRKNHTNKHYKQHDNRHNFNNRHNRQNRYEYYDQYIPHSGTRRRKY